MSETLPIVDMSARPADLAEAVGAAARGVGFFYVTGHGIDQALFDAVFDGSRQFFALSADTKERQSIRRSPHNRGYVGMKGESLDPTKAPDLKEA